MTRLRRRIEGMKARRAPGPLAVLALKMNGETRVIAMEGLPKGRSSPPLPGKRALPVGAPLCRRGAGA